MSLVVTIVAVATIVAVYAGGTWASWRWVCRQTRSTWVRVPITAFVAAFSPLWVIGWLRWRWVMGPSRSRRPWPTPPRAS